MRWAVPLLMCLAMAGVAYGDPTNLEDGVFIAHHPPGVQYSQGTDWCQKYIDEYAITSCKQQHNRIDLDGNVGESSVWYVLAAWDESKEWCGTEFGFGQYDANTYGFLRWGPCSPQGELELPTDNWPAPNEGTAITTTSTAWSGNFVPVYYFAGYAYYEGVIPLAADPATGFGGTGNCVTPPEAWVAADFGGMGLFSAGTYVCPEGELDGGEGGPGGQEDHPGGGGGGLDYATDAVIIRFSPDVISFPQDREYAPRYFEAPLEDAVLAIPSLDTLLADIGAVSFATIAPGWRHLTPDRSLDFYGNPVDLVDFTDVYRVTLAGETAVEDAIGELWGKPGIVYAEQDGQVTLYDMPEAPNDPYYADSCCGQWYLNNDEDNECGGCVDDVDMNVPEAWGLCYERDPPIKAGTKIANLEMRVNETHEDLEAFIDYSLSGSFVIEPGEWVGGVESWGGGRGGSRHEYGCAGGSRY